MSEKRLKANIHHNLKIMASYNVHVDKNLLFVAVYPVALMLSFIRSLKRLAIASGLANILEMVGITIVLQYLFRSLDKVDMGQRDKFMPLDQVALGFGSAMFAFEGISVILPVYTRMKNPNRMSGCWGVINMSFALLCLLYFMVGLFGFLIFGRNAGDSITLNLPSEPLYDLVRASFTIAVFLTYPLQFYVPNEIIWNWAKNNLIKADPKPAIEREGQNEAPTPAIRIIDCDDHEEAEPETNGTAQDPQTRIESSNRDEQNQTQEPPGDNQSRLEYLCRAIIVTFTFAVAISVPKLNLLMDLIGSITGTILSLILPAIIHLAACWEDSSGYNRLGMLLVNSLIIVVGLTAGSCSFTSSLVSIVNSF